MVFICGIINILITVTKIRKLIIHAIPESMQHAIGGGIGIFVAYVGIKMLDSFRLVQTHLRLPAVSLKAAKRLTLQSIAELFLL